MEYHDLTNHVHQDDHADNHADDYDHYADHYHSADHDDQDWHKMWAEALQ